MAKTKLGIDLQYIDALKDLLAGTADYTPEQLESENVAGNALRLARLAFRMSQQALLDEAAAREASFKTAQIQPAQDEAERPPSPANMPVSRAEAGKGQILLGPVSILESAMLTSTLFTDEQVIVFSTLVASALDVPPRVNVSIEFPPHSEEEGQLATPFKKSGRPAGAQIKSYDDDVIESASPPAADGAKFLQPSTTLTGGDANEAIPEASSRVAQLAAPPPAIISAATPAASATEEEPPFIYDRQKRASADVAHAVLEHIIAIRPAWDRATEEALRLGAEREALTDFRERSRASSRIGQAVRETAADVAPRLAHMMELLEIDFIRIEEDPVFPSSRAVDEIQIGLTQRIRESLGWTRAELATRVPMTFSQLTTEHQRAVFNNTVDALAKAMRRDYTPDEIAAYQSIIHPHTLDAGLVGIISSYGYNSTLRAIFTRVDDSPLIIAILMSREARSEGTSLQATPYANGPAAEAAQPPLPPIAGGAQEAGTSPPMPPPGRHPGSNPDDPIPG